MGVLYDYFAAASDEQAAATIDLDGGPAGAALPPDGMDSTVWTVPRVRLSGHGLHVLAVKGIDPVVQLATLEELLTGVDTDAIFDHPRCGRDLAVRDGGERLVLTLTDELRDAVAAATPERLADVAGAWVQTEEFFGDGDPVLGAHFLRELSTLAKGARERGERLYCWVCT